MTGASPNRMVELLDRGVFVLLFVVLPLEHTPAMRYLLCVILALRGLWELVVVADRSLIRRAWGVGFWVAWASASYLWSVAPETTLANLKHDLWIPVLAMVGAYSLFRRQSRPDLLLWAVAAGSAANGFAAIFGLPQSPYPLALATYYVSTVAYSSTCALYFSAVALPWLLDKEQPRLRVLAVVVLAINIAIGVMMESRAFIATTTLLLAVVVGLMVLRGQRRNAYFITAAVIALTTAFVFVNRDRTVLLTGRSEIAAGIDHVLTSEVRFAIWQRWAERIEQGPSLGVGFGRDVPPLLVTPAERQTLSSIDRFAAMHAHNIFLSVLAETGWPGVMFFLVMLAQLAWHFLSAVRSKDATTARVGLSGLFLIVAMTLKNQTDVLMVFGPAVLFYAALGGLLAWPRAPRSSS